MSYLESVERELVTARARIKKLEAASVDKEITEVLDLIEADPTMDSAARFKERLLTASYPILHSHIEGVYDIHIANEVRMLRERHCDE